MKKDTILVALSIGLAVFLMRWIRAYTPIENYEIHFLPLFGIYWGIKMYFKHLKISSSDNLTNLVRAFWVGFRMSLIAAVFTGILCMLFVTYPANTIRMFSPFYLHSFPFISTAAYGILVSIICSAVYVYFKPLKFHIKLHSGHLFY